MILEDQSHINLKVFIWEIYIKPKKINYGEIKLLKLKITIIIFFHQDIVYQNLKKLQNLLLLKKINIL